MTGPRVRVELGPPPNGNHVWVDGKDIGNLVTAVHIECTAAGANVAKVSIDLFPAEVQVDGELIEAIQPVLVQREVTP